MEVVLLKRDAPGTFRRFIRDEAGNILRILSFEPGVPVELNAEDYAAVREHIGKALELPRSTQEAPQVSKEEVQEQVRELRKPFKRR